MPAVPKISPSVFAEAYKLSKSDRMWRKMEAGDRYIFASASSGITTQDELAAAYNEAVRSFSSFKEYEANRFKVAPYWH